MATGKVRRIIDIEKKVMYLQYLHLTLAESNKIKVKVTHILTANLSKMVTDRVQATNGYR